MIRLSLVAAGLLAAATCRTRVASPFDYDLLDGGMDTVDAGPPMCAPCQTWSPVELLSPLPAPLESLSGLAVSRAHRGIVYANNGKGESRFYAVRYDGVPIAELELDGANAVDFEDMAIGPCGTATCLFLADMGDELTTRTDYAVFRVPEPVISAARPVGPLTVAFDRLRFEYPGSQRHDAQTLLVHPQTGDVYILTRAGSGTPSHVYKFPRPLLTDATMTLIDLGPASVPALDDGELTGGSVHPCGNALLLRLENRVVELTVPDGGTFDQIFKTTPVELPSPIDEPEPKAIGWGPDGTSYFTASELTGQSLHRVQCLAHP